MQTQILCCSTGTRRAISDPELVPFFGRVPSLAELLRLTHVKVGWGLEKGFVKEHVIQFETEAADWFHGIAASRLNRSQREGVTECGKTMQMRL